MCKTVESTCAIFVVGQFNDEQDYPKIWFGQFPQVVIPVYFRYCKGRSGYKSTPLLEYTYVSGVLSYSVFKSGRVMSAPSPHRESTDYLIALQPDKEIRKTERNPPRPP